ACNLAAALAQVHHTVLLVDGDLVRHATHPVLAAEESPGLNAVLHDEASLEQAFRAGPVEGLTVLPAGDAPRDSTEGLDEVRFTKMLAEVDGSFDSIVILAPSPTTFD